MNRLAWCALALCGVQAMAAGVVNDFDGDGLSDGVHYDEPTGSWRVDLSLGRTFPTTAVMRLQFGFPGTIPMAGDFDGDARADYALFDPPSGMWYFLKSSAGYSTTHFGYFGSVPVTGDFDGDGRTDVGCFEAARGAWSLLLSSGGVRTVSWGYPGTLPITGDFDGDGRSDIGCYHPVSGRWDIQQSSGGTLSTVFGGDVFHAPENYYIPRSPVWGRFDGDARDDLAFIEKSYGFTGTAFAVRYSSGGEVSRNLGGFDTYTFGTGDFDGDGRTDLQSAARGYYLTGETNDYGHDFAYIYNDYTRYQPAYSAPLPVSENTSWYPDSSQIVPFRYPRLPAYTITRKDGRRFTLTGPNSVYVAQNIATIKDYKGASAVAYVGRVGNYFYLSSAGTANTGPITIMARQTPQYVATPFLISNFFPIYVVIDACSGVYIDATGSQSMSASRQYLGMPYF